MLPANQIAALFNQQYSGGNTGVILICYIQINIQEGVFSVVWAQSRHTQAKINLSYIAGRGFRVPEH